MPHAPDLSKISLGVVFPHRNFFPWGMGKNGEGKFFSHGEMGKNGESYFGFELTKNGTKSTLFEFRACFLATSFFRTNVYTIYIFKSFRFFL